MAARTQKRGVKPQQRRAQVSVAPHLTRQEIKQLKDRADSDLRSLNQS